MKKIIEAFEWLVIDSSGRDVGILNEFTHVDTRNLRSLIASGRLESLLFTYWNLSCSDIPKDHQNLMLRLTHKYKPETQEWNPDSGQHPFSIADFKTKANEILMLLRVDLNFC